MNTNDVKANRIAFLSAVEEVDVETQRLVLWMVDVIANKILDGQDKHFKNPTLARKDAESFVAQLIWNYSGGASLVE